MAEYCNISTTILILIYFLFNFYSSTYKGFEFYETKTTILLFSLRLSDCLILTCNSLWTNRKKKKDQIRFSSLAIYSYRVSLVFWSYTTYYFDKRQKHIKPLVMLEMIFVCIVVKRVINVYVIKNQTKPSVSKIKMIKVYDKKYIIITVTVAVALTCVLLCLTAVLYAVRSACRGVWGHKKMFAEKK